MLSWITLRPNLSDNPGQDVGVPSFLPRTMVFEASISPLQESHITLTCL